MTDMLEAMLHGAIEVFRKGVVAQLAEVNRIEIR
jgi:hypothetical protein